MAPLLHRAAIKIGHLRTTAHLSGCIFAAKACIDNRKNLPQQISTGFAFWLHYCSDVVHRRPTKLCTMFVRLLGCYIMYTLAGAFAPWRHFASCKIHFASKSCVLLYWQCYCTAREQRPSAKLCGVVQWMELRNFRRGRHLGWAVITLGIGPHSSFYFLFLIFLFLFSVPGGRSSWLTSVSRYSIIIVSHRMIVAESKT